MESEKETVVIHLQTKKSRISSNHQKQMGDKVGFYPKEHDITNTLISDFQLPKLF